MHYNDDALEESPELLLQLDGANDSDVERPGKTEVVTGREPEEEEKDGGGWVVVETQRKTREVLTSQEESRTGRMKRLYPALIKCNFTMDWLAREEERIGKKRMQRLEEEEVEECRKMNARIARG